MWKSLLQKLAVYLCRPENYCSVRESNLCHSQFCLHSEWGSGKLTTYLSVLESLQIEHLQHIHWYQKAYIIFIGIRKPKTQSLVPEGLQFIHWDKKAYSIFISIKKPTTYSFGIRKPTIYSFGIRKHITYLLVSGSYYFSVGTWKSITYSLVPESQQHIHFISENLHHSY